MWSDTSSGDVMSELLPGDPLELGEPLANRGERATEDRCDLLLGHLVDVIEDRDLLRLSIELGQELRHQPRLLRIDAGEQTFLVEVGHVLLEALAPLLLLRCDHYEA